MCVARSSLLENAIVIGIFAKAKPGISEWRVGSMVWALARIQNWGAGALLRIFLKFNVETLYVDFRAFWGQLEISISVPVVS